MGWLEYSATEWKNGKIDRKAELLKVFNWKTDEAQGEILKISMKGSTAYMAVKYTNFKDSTKNCVFGVVCLTSVRDRYYFAYKDMSESMSPGYFDCPASIISLLTPTDNEWANEWRQKCLEKKNSFLSQMNKAKEGSTLTITYNCDTKFKCAGDTDIFEKRITHTRTGRKKTIWKSQKGFYRASATFIDCFNPQWINYIS